MGISISDVLFEEGSFGVFLLVTIILGGGASWLTGRAIAATWRPIWQVIIYTLVLGAVVRFFHMALFGGTRGGGRGRAGVCLAFGFAGFQTARAAQMARQYGWLMQRHGAIRWRRKIP